ncbi:TrmB family transcriptional regulator [Candidatus Woesearchaeota archaeon]|nr:TrmB family transcriptional regulator [Candidatus Woesearchaeota archaeon]
MIEENLSKLGFSPSEVKIYLHLLKQGSSYPNKISSVTKINRTNVYEALDRLISKGVVSFIIKNKLKWFEAKSPNSILSLINKKQEEFEETKKDVLKDVKKLKKTINPDKKTLEANVFVGKKGLRILFEDILEERKQISLIGAQLQFKKVFGGYFELWHKKRIKKGIKQRSIFPLKLKQKVKGRKLLKYKFVENKFTNPTTTIIYGDNCLFIQWSKEPIAIKIQNKDIVKSHLNYFNLLWKS